MKRAILAAASLAAAVALSAPAGAAGQTEDSASAPPCHDRPLVQCVKEMLVCAPPGCGIPPLGDYCERIWTGPCP